MELTRFILWLVVGAVIGWFAHLIVSIEHRWTHKPVPGVDLDSKMS